MASGFLQSVRNDGVSHGHLQSVPKSVDFGNIKHFVHLRMSLTCSEKHDIAGRKIFHRNKNLPPLIELHALWGLWAVKERWATYGRLAMRYNATTSWRGQQRIATNRSVP